MACCYIQRDIKISFIHSFLHKDSLYGMSNLLKLCYRHMQSLYLFSKLADSMGASFRGVLISWGANKRMYNVIMAHNKHKA